MDGAKTCVREVVEVGQQWAGLRGLWMLSSQLSPRKGSCDPESDMMSWVCGEIGMECVERTHREGARGREPGPVGSVVRRCAARGKEGGRNRRSQLSLSP